MSEDAFLLSSTESHNYYIYYLYATEHNKGKRT